MEYAWRVVAKIGIKADESHAKTLDILAAAYTRDGQYDRAVEAEQKALDLCKAVATTSERKKGELAGAFEQRLHLYGEKTVYVDDLAESKE